MSIEKSSLHSSLERNLNGNSSRSVTVNSPSRSASDTAAPGGTGTPRGAGPGSECGPGTAALPLSRERQWAAAWQLAGHCSVKPGAPT
eukprot:132867-Hanusia_phi.AAC.1